MLSTNQSFDSLTCLMYDNTNCPTRTLMDNSGQKSLYEGRVRWNERDLTKSACFRVVCISNGAGRNYKKNQKHLQGRSHLQQLFVDLLPK